ncbi:hydrolase [Serratia odorifera]|uniref:hydrolase n=1 Tax=Serratia odorifera TaxID=618 RepID=UPI0018E74F4A|nr:hydrolase [Serratia odorifera]MBJ2064296.1 hydrolase [Serratia odorifera]HEJ9093959.1 hydrolase [Serratia odorifera]
MLNIDAQTTALVVIDLQNGILPYAGGPHSAEQVVTHAAHLAGRFRALGAPVMMVRVGWSDTFAEALKQPVDRPTPAPVGGLPADWWTFPEALAVDDSDILIVKRQWGAFYGTDLEMQLRRRGITTLVLGGIATNIGVESTARAAWERGFELIIAEDMCSAPNAEMHRFAFENIFPRLARVRSTGEILAALQVAR